MTPSLGTSTCHRCSPMKEKKRKKVFLSSFKDSPKQGGALLGERSGGLITGNVIRKYEFPSVTFFWTRTSPVIQTCWPLFGFLEGRAPSSVSPQDLCMCCVLHLGHSLHSGQLLLIPGGVFLCPPPPPTFPNPDQVGSPWASPS